MKIDSLYAQRFANARLNGAVAAPCSAQGVMAWSQVLARGKPVEARGLLTVGEIVLVDTLQSIIAYSAAGVRLWERDKFYGTPVVIRDGLIYYTRAARRSRMEVIDTNNTVKHSDVWIPNVSEQAALILFDPFEVGMTAQVQMSDVPDADEQEVLIYQRVDGGLGFAWSCAFPHGRASLPPIICREQSRLVAAVDAEAMVFELFSKQRSAQPLARFPLPFGMQTQWLSADATGLLYWCGIDRRRAALCVTDLTGKEVWRWMATGGLSGQEQWVAPAVVSDACAHIVTSQAIYAVANGKNVWDFKSSTPLVGATALNEGSLLVSSAKSFMRFDATGKVVCDVPSDVAYVTPPVVDTKGNVYVASTGAVHAFH